MFPFIALSFAVLFVSIGVSNYLFLDALLRLEYKHHKSEWEKDGKPIGYFWRSKETSFWQGAIARNSVAHKWYDETPEWIQLNPKAQKLVIWYRWTSRGTFLLWVALVVYLISSYGCNKQ